MAWTCALSIGMGLPLPIRPPETTAETRSNDMRKRFFALATVAARMVVAVSAQASVRDHRQYSDTFADDL
jgi:hypothetical protein